VPLGLLFGGTLRVAIEVRAGILDSSVGSIRRAAET